METTASDNKTRSFPIPALVCGLKYDSVNQWKTSAFNILKTNTMEAT